VRRDMVRVHTNHISLQESLPRAMSPVNRAAPVAAILPNNGAEHLLVIASLH
jgi:hypothetical protein